MKKNGAFKFVDTKRVGSKECKKMHVDSSKDLDLEKILMSGFRDMIIRFLDFEDSNP